MLMRTPREHLQIHDSQGISAIGNFLLEFFPDHWITKDIQELREEMLERDRIRAEALFRKRKLGGRGKPGKVRRPRRFEVREPPQMPPIGVCDCGGVLRGIRLPSCETNRTGRVFYSECDSCSFWMELIRDGDQYIERGELIGG